MDNEQELMEFLAELEQDDHRSNNDELVPPGQRECPICKTKMSVDREYGVAIDVCVVHGIWLDRGELAAVILRVKSGERIERRKAVRNAKRQGKYAGMHLGMWSLLFSD